MCSVGFTKTDLQNVINIIDVCTKRGAFHASELSGVGSLYDKFSKLNIEMNNNDTSTQCEGVSADVSESVSEGVSEGNVVSNTTSSKTNIL